MFELIYIVSVWGLAQTHQTGLSLVRNVLKLVKPVALRFVHKLADGGILALVQTLKVLSGIHIAGAIDDGMCGCGADQVHHMLMPLDSNGEVDQHAARFMRNMVLTRLLQHGQQNQLTVFTGSYMAPVWASMAAGRVDGYLMLHSCHSVHLPADFPADHMALHWEQLTVRQPAPQALLKHCPQRPACVENLVEDWVSTGHLSGLAAAEYAGAWIHKELVQEVLYSDLGLLNIPQKISAQGTCLMQAVTPWRQLHLYSVALSMAKQATRAFR